MAQGSPQAGNDGGADPESGRGLVAIVGAIGLLTIVGYAMCRPDRAPPTAAPVAARAEGPALETLTEQAQVARRKLDVQALGQVEQALMVAAQRESMAPKLATVRMELADVLSTQALEASIRASVVEAGEAKPQSGPAIDKARDLLAALDGQAGDTARVRSAQARLGLAQGEDVAQRFPVLLLPTYRDQELRLAALATPLWREGTDGEFSAEANDELITELRAAPADSVLVQLLLSIALERRGDGEQAMQVIDQILTESPGQPTALALRHKWAAAAPPTSVVAALDPPAVADPVPPDPAPDPAAAVPTETPVPTPPVEPPPIEPPVNPPTEALPPDPPPAKASPPKPKPPKPARPKAPRPPKASNDYDTLVADGCKAARGGAADKGLELLKKAHDLKPGATKVVLCMAEAHLKMGNAASAKAMCERVLRKAPTNKRALLLAGRIEDARGNTRRALDHFRKVLDQDPDNKAAKAYVEKHG